MPDITPNDIHSIRNFDTLLDFLREKLGWHIPEDVEFEDVAYPLSAEDLDLDELTQDRIGDYWQLPPFPPSQPTLGIFEDTQPWGIFFLQFNSTDIYRTALRRVLRGLVERRDRNSSLPTWEHDHLLFICTTTDFKRFAFAHFASSEALYETVPARVQKNWRRAVLSIFSWEQGDTHIRTLCEYNLPALVFPSDGFSSDQEWLQAWQKAFDVEAVTDKFFADYQRVFARVEDAMEGIPDSELEGRRLYVQRLFNQLMFLRFIEKKGWITYDGNRNYLRSLFDATEAQTDENFLNDRLYWTFFHGLGNAADQSEESSAAVERRGEVPFLNGGLFEMQDCDCRGAVHIPNDVFAEILKFFERYNFTVTESTPIDIEVAVDPEMLGKVFEELVTSRHDTGSYYTPRPVVSFMCRESLKICLQNKTDETRECIQMFVDTGHAGDIRDPEKVLRVLQTLRILDPACGSGAYLLGMMGELLRLRDALFKSSNVDPKTTYQRKLDIIQQNLYGVDKDEFAVNIAMLRLWLSLAVDYEGDTPEPLPNLDYKVAAGDSLIGPAPKPPERQVGHEDHLIQEIQEWQAVYLVTHADAEKQELREVIAELKGQLHGWQADTDGFVWQVEFPEVFQEGGFDIVIGNPPYVQQELIRAVKPTLKKRFPEVFVGTADLYVYFYKRGVELLRTGGVLAYISSNKFMRAGYGEKLRMFFTSKLCFHKLLDFGSVSVFGASVDTCIVLVENTPPCGEAFLASTFPNKSEIPRLSTAFEKHAFSMHARDLSPDGWVLTSPDIIALLKVLRDTGTPFSEVVQGKFYFGIKTGCNDAFILDGATYNLLIAKDSNSRELIKPMLRGRTLRKWKAESANEYLIAIASSVNRKWPWSDVANSSEAEQIFSETYPAIYQHLIGYRDRLIAREDQGRFYWELRSCAYYEAFAEPRIIYPDISSLMRACYETGEIFGEATTFCIPTTDLSLLAILNSQLFDWYARHKFQTLNDPWMGGRLRFKTIYMQHLPIAQPTVTQKAELSHLVEQILAGPGNDRVRNIERKIDRLVYALYGLTEAQIRLIKRTYRDAGMEI